MLKDLRLRKVRTENQSLHWDLPCVWTLQKGQECDNLWCRNKYIKW